LCDIHWGIWVGDGFLIATLFKGSRLGVVVIQDLGIYISSQIIEFHAFSLI